MIDIKLLGNKIRELRTNKGLTQTEFASVLSVSFQAVSNWERGIAPPELENLVRIASYFGILVDDLLYENREPLYLGIDGGGTKTEFCVVNASGNVVTRLLEGGCNPNDIGFLATSSLIHKGIKELISKNPNIVSAHLGIAGISGGNYIEKLNEELKKSFPKLKISILNDSSNLFAFDDSVDMTIISGTGSVAFVRNGSDYTRIGGWGYLFDEAGSAFDIGRDAVRQALYEEDNKLSSSILSNKLYKKMGTECAWANVKELYSRGKPYIASLAGVVFEAYNDGDKCAEAIIDKTAKALAHLLDAGVSIYGAKPVAIASGGIFEHYTDVITKKIYEHTTVKLIICDLPPIYGACRKAVMNDQIADFEFYNNFKNTYGGKI